MSLTAIFLVIISAFVHAGWNLVCKKGNPTASFVLLANLTGTFFLLPIFILNFKVLFVFPLEIWIMLLCTGFFMAVYHVALAGAYRKGDMSVAYPLARSSPIIVVAVVTLFLGEGKYISGSCILGIFLIVIGCFILPLKDFKNFHPKNYLSLTCFLALIAAFGTAGYSIIDDSALEILRTSINCVDIVFLTLLYAFLENICVFGWLLLLIFSSKTERKRLHETIIYKKKSAAVMGIGIIVGYSLVLIAMSFAENISYIVAFRQLSIPIGAVFSMSLLKEPVHVPKLFGTFILFCGLIFVALG